MSSRRCALLAVSAGLLTGLTLPAAASAHGLGGAGSFPIPGWLFAWAASIVLVASFVALATLWPEPRLSGAPASRAEGRESAWSALAGAVGLVGFGLVVVAGLAGEQSNAARNLAPVAIFVVLWVGVPVACLLFGDVFRAVSPWRAIARLAAWGGRRVGLPGSPPLTYPERLGQWPAAAGILAFACLELVDVHRERPSTLAVLAIAYAAIQLVGMAAYGMDVWERHADGLAVLFGLFARLSPVDWRNGRPRPRNPLGRVAAIPVLPGTTALLVVAIGSTSFDGASRGGAWGDARRALRPLLGGLGPSGASEASAGLGLVVMILLVALVYRSGVRGMQAIGPHVTAGELSRRFAHTLVPIALGYLLAHYLSSLLIQGQALGYLVSDPLGEGANLFGTAHASIDAGILDRTLTWYLEVAALLAGHVVALMLAHDCALALFSRGWDLRALRPAPGGMLVLDSRGDAAVRSQYWMLGVTVSFTCLGLWLLAGAG